MDAEDDGEIAVDGDVVLKWVGGYSGGVEFFG